MAFDWLTRRKERDEKKAAYKDRIPPGQSMTDKWPVLHYGDIPDFRPQLWDFSITGLVANPRKFSYEEFLALPATLDTSDIHCVTGWSKFDNEWEGIRVKALLDKAGPTADARYVVIQAEQGYTTNLPLDDLLDDNVLLAYKHNGQDLTPEHGWPLRLVVPKLYFWKSAKWVRGFELLDHDERGFWENYGYHNYGNPWKEERYSWQEG